MLTVNTTLFLIRRTKSNGWFKCNRYSWTLLFLSQYLLNMDKLKISHRCWSNRLENSRWHWCMPCCDMSTQFVITHFVSLHKLNIGCNRCRLFLSQEGSSKDPRGKSWSALQMAARMKAPPPCQSVRDPLVCFSVIVWCSAALFVLLI